MWILGLKGLNSGILGPGGGYSVYERGGDARRLS